MRDAKWSTRRNIPEGSMLLKGNTFALVADSRWPVVWSPPPAKRSGANVNAGEFAASPILCQDRIYCFSLTGKCVVVAASPMNSRCWPAADLRTTLWPPQPSPATP